MIFTTKAEYGVRMLIQLGRQGTGHPVSLKAIAEAENLPLAYCERIAALLKKHDLVVSTRAWHSTHPVTCLARYSPRAIFSGVDCTVTFPAAGTSGSLAKR